MKNRILDKLRSRTGASISFALLLFLVCAVLCSVILTAATTASGRMSNMAETDQRYYAVTSAAELMKDVFEEHPTVSVVKIEKSWTDTTYQNGTVTGTTDAGVPDGETASAVYIVIDKTAAEISESDLITELTDSYATKTIQEDAARRVFNADESNTTGTLLSSRGLTITSTFSSTAGMDFDALAVDILEKLEAKGNIELTMYNKYKSGTTASDAGSRYKVILSLGADKNKTTNTKTETVSSAAIDENSYTETTKTTTTTITTLTWTLTGIKTNS